MTKQVSQLTSTDTFNVDGPAPICPGRWGLLWLVKLRLEEGVDER